MKWIGLTGGMGCGKSTALEVFKRLDFGTASADSVVHALYQKEEVIIEVCKALNIEVGDFSLSKVSELVFSDGVRLHALERVIHPKVNLEVQKIRKGFEKQNMFISVYEVPLLFEKSMENNFDYTLCIGASEEVQMERIRKRNLWSDAEIKARISVQMSLEEKRKKADFYVDNSGTLADLEGVCKKLIGNF